MSSSNLSLGVYDKAVILLIEAKTPLHPGVGRGSGLVDLPVQRDALNYPVIYASSIKGSLKSQFLAIADQDTLDDIYELFGPDPETAETTFTGAVAITDGYLLAIPARSLNGVYIHLTCPFLLRRFKECLDLCRNLHGVESFQELAHAIRAVLDISLKDKTLYLGDGDSINRVKVNSIESDEQIPLAFVNEEILALEKLDALTSIASHFFDEEDEQWRFGMVKDELFYTLLAKSLLRVARIRLARGTKKVQPGGLWVEEYIPQKALFYTSLFFSKSRKPESSQSSEALMRRFKEMLDRSGGYLILGGNETVGKGLVKISFLGGF